MFRVGEGRGKDFPLSLVLRQGRLTVVGVLFRFWAGPALQGMGYQLYEQEHHQGGQEQIDQSDNREYQNSIHRVCLRAGLVGA
ncbi:hypothetical protein ACG10_08025 [Azotobacter chroococcum]|nr:hypothetical protein ACG10_08025 [Azotobacter chroococcum]